MFESAKAMVTRAATRLGLDQSQINGLLQPDAEHTFEIEVNGQKHAGYRIQHSNKRGPYKGGIRFHSKVDLDEVRALAMLMSLKTAAVGIPLGGGKGGVVISPKEHTPEHIEQVARKYVTALKDHIGPDKDVPAPDVNTNAEIMRFMVDEYEKLTGDTTKASFTGKPLDYGGSEGREAATGRGGVIVLREYLRTLPKSDKPLTVAVQGLGNVGFFFAQIAEEQLPIRIVAVSNSRQTLNVSQFSSNDQMISFKDIPFDSDSSKLMEQLASDHIEVLSSDAIISLDVDILVLAALEDAITESNSAEAKADIIVELANGPVTDTAHTELTERGRVVIPDIIANAGGVIVSYLEWKQNLAQETWTEQRVNQELDTILSSATQKMITLSTERSISLKEAAFQTAIQRLVEA